MWAPLYLSSPLPHALRPPLFQRLGHLRTPKYAEGSEPSSFFSPYKHGGWVTTGLLKAVSLLLTVFKAAVRYTVGRVVFVMQVYSPIFSRGFSGFSGVFAQDLG